MKQIKQIISTIRSKADAIKTRLTIATLTVLSKKKKFSIAMISTIFTTAKNHHNRSTTAIIAPGDDVDPTSNAIVLYNNNNGHYQYYLRDDDDDDDGGDDKYPDLRHSLFDEEEEEELADLLQDPNSSVSAIDLVKNTKENGGESFNLEDEINEVADLFITKFHKKMRLQKLLSFKRHQQQQMIERSA